MTIGTTSPRVSFLCDGVTTVFPVPIQSYLATDFAVILSAPISAGGAQTTLVLNSAYTLATSGTLQPTAWTLATIGEPLTAGYTLQVFLNPVQSQQTQYVQGQAFPSLAVQTNFDRLTQMVQRLQDQENRTLKVPDGDASPMMALPIAALRANLWQAYDAQGNSSLVTGLPVGQTLSTAILAPFLGLNQSAAEALAGVVPTNVNYPVLNVKRYGAVGDGVTDDGTAIRSAWKVAKAQGGGTIVLPFGLTYLVSSLDSPASLNLPSQNSDGSVSTQPVQVQLYFQSGNNTVFDFQGSTIKSPLTGGGVLMIFDACNNIRLLGPKFVGVQVQSTGVVALGTIVGGSGYTSGSYNNVPLTGGSGGGAIGAVTVVGGIVTAVTIQYPGGSYAVADTLSASNTNLGGAGSGFTVPVLSVSGAGPTVVMAAPNALTVCSLTGPSSNITVTDLDVESCYTGFWCIASGNNNNQITNITLLGYTQIRNGEYGLALHNGGDHTVIENLYTYRVSRPFFIYGAQQVNIISCFGDQNNFGFQPIIKAYSRNTRDISVRYTAGNAPGQSGAVQELAIQVQCDPAVINPPPTVQNIYLDWDEENFKFGGTGIQFNYYSGAGGAVLTATSANSLFSNIVIKGSSGNILNTTVQLASNVQCLTNFDLFQYVRPGNSSDLNSNNGFVVSRRFTYTPAILFGGSATGWVFSTQTADYYIAGGLCTVIGQITVSTKGSATGACTILMPFPTRADSSRAPLIDVVGTTGFATLAGALVGFINSGTATANLQTQGAAAVTAVTDANFTASSNLLFQASYPL